MKFNEALCGRSTDRLIYSSLAEVDFDGPECDRQTLEAAGHIALVNCNLVAGEHILGKSKRPLRQAERQLRRDAYSRTMGDLESSGSVTVLIWLLRPVFMWLLRRFLKRLIDNYFAGRSSADRTSRI